MTSLSIQDFFVNNFKDIAYLVGAVVTFFLGRKIRVLNVKKEEASVQTTELDNVEAALKIYRVMLSDLQQKLTEAEQAYQVLEQRFQSSLEEKRALEEENIKLKQELDEIKGNS